MNMYITRLGRCAAVGLALMVCIVLIRHKGNSKIQVEEIISKQASKSSTNIKRVKIRSQQSQYQIPDVTEETTNEQSAKHTKSIQPENHKKNSKSVASNRGAKPTTIRNYSRQTFQPLDEEGRIRVYSAHYDTILERVKIVGLGPMQDDIDLKFYRCKLKRKDGSVIKVGALNIYYRISTYFPWKNQTYDSFIYTCGLVSEKPHFVTLVSVKTTTISINLLTEPQSDNTEPKYTFSVCVEPLVLHYSNTSLLRHFIAVNTALGAEHFYFYITDASTAIIDILTSLRHRVTIYSWPLHTLLNKTHAYGQKAANNHCLYAHRLESRYLVYIDIDEVLVPNDGLDWKEMMDKVNTENPDNGAVIYQSKLFPSNQQAARGDAKSHDVIGLTHTGTVGLFPYHEWSKVLLNASRVDIMDIHRVRELLPNYQAIYRNSTYGHIHHYRHLSNLQQQKLYVDKSLIQYKQKILDMYKNLFHFQ